MPELPEVESLRRILTRSATGRGVVNVTVAEARLRRTVAPDFAAMVAGRTIERIERRAKYLLLYLSGGHVMIVHLGMSGSLTHRGEGFSKVFNPRHDHIIFELDDGSRLVYNDPRRFGLIKLVERSELAAVEELKGLGPEPLSEQFSAEYLFRATRRRTASIKNVLMDQRIVAGIGNIYASEILFRAAIRPTRRAGETTRAELEKVVAATSLILNAAISSRGTTFRSYRDSQGEPGAFVTLLAVYGRVGQPCGVCATPIKSVIVGQRSSFYCPRCQR